MPTTRLCGEFFQAPRTSERSRYDSICHGVSNPSTVFLAMRMPPVPMKSSDKNTTLESEPIAEKRRTQSVHWLPHAEGLARIVLSVAAAWSLALGFDVLLHAGLLANLYVDPQPFLLGPDEAFQRIPIGYLSFLLLTLVLYWLMKRLDVRGVAAGFRFGVIAAVLAWGTFALGLYSITTVTQSLLLAWWVGQVVQWGLTGAVLGAASKGAPLKRIWAIVVACILIFFAITVVLQSTGLAPPMRVV